MRSAKIALLAALVLAVPGCIIDDPLDPCYGDCCYDDCGPYYGDIGFWWSFELDDGSVTDDCILADVARVDTRVYDEWDDLEYTVLDRPCGDLGLVMTNFEEGSYYIELTARCNRGTTTHEALYDVWVEPGMNDYGDLMLDYLRPCM